MNIAETAERRTTVTSGAYSYYVLAMLTLCYTLSFIDAKLPFILLEDIKRDLALSDTMLGVITGPAFSLVYAVTAFPIAKVSDSGSRKIVLSVAVLLWSCFTAAGGLARNAVEFVLSRAGVAFGEAACTPAAHSMIADHYAPARRGWAISVFMSGNVLGTGIALAGGGMLAEAHSWRWAMFLVGGVGFLLCAAMFLTVREPIRIAAHADKHLALPDASFVALFRDKAFFYSVAGATLLCVSLGSSVTWTPAYLIRHYGLPTGQVGLLLGAVSVGAGLLGTMTGGMVVDAMRKRSAGAGYAFLAAAFALCTFFRVGSFYTEGLAGFLILHALAWFIMAFYSGGTYSTVQLMVGPRSRSRASAILLFFCNGIGIAGGAFLTGFLSDHLSGTFGQDSLRISLIALALASLPAAWAYWRGGVALRYADVQISV